MKKVRVVVRGQKNQLEFEKKKRGLVYVFEGEIFSPGDSKKYVFCPFCGEKILHHSEIVCPKCKRGIGFLIGDCLRVLGNPFRNWRFLPNNGEEIFNISIFRFSAEGP